MTEKKGQIVEKKHSTLAKATEHVGGLIGTIFSVLGLFFWIVVTFVIDFTPPIFEGQWYYFGFTLMIIITGLNIIKHGNKAIFGRIRFIHAINAFTSAVIAICLTLLRIIYPFTLDNYLEAANSNLDISLSSIDGIIKIILIIVTFVTIIETVSESVKFVLWEEGSTKSLIAS